MDFVTGGTGLVGSHILYTLLSNGRSVRALKRADSDISICQKIFTYYGDTDNQRFNQIEWVDGELTDIFSLADALDGIEDVYHCAAMVSFHKKDAKKLLKINGEGTANLINACLDAGIRKFGHVSSTAAVGKAKKGQLTTEKDLWKKEKHTSNYSISKYAAEREAWRGTQEGLDVVVVNPSVIVGPGDWQKSSNHLFYTIKHGLKYYPTGSNGFVDVRDVANALYQLMHSDIKGERFLLVGENLSFKTYFEMIAKHFGVKPPSRKAGKLATGFAWRFLGMIQAITGKKASVTKETARSAQAHIGWKTDKIEEAIGFQFTPIDAAVENAVGFYDGKV